MTPEEQAAADAEAAEAATKAELETKERVDAEQAFEEGYTGTVPTVAEKTPEEIQAETDAAALEAKAIEDAKVLEAVKVTPTPKISDEQLQTLLQKANSVDEVVATLEKFRGDAFSRIGGLERTIKALNNTTVSGQPIEATAEDFKELLADVPEITPKIVTGLTRVLSKFKSTGTPAPVETEEEFNARVDKRADERIAKRLQEREERQAMKELTDKHADWQTVIGGPESTTEFRTWLKTQPYEEATTVLSSWDPKVVGASLDKFKASKTPLVVPAPKAEVKPVVPATSARTQRLAEAIPAKGGATAPTKPRQKTDQEEFEEGFKS